MFFCCKYVANISQICCGNVRGNVIFFFFLDKLKGNVFDLLSLSFSSFGKFMYSVFIK